MAIESAIVAPSISSTGTKFNGLNFVNSASIGVPKSAELEYSKTV